MSDAVLNKDTRISKLVEDAGSRFLEERIAARVDVYPCPVARAFETVGGQTADTPRGEGEVTKKSRLFRRLFFIVWRKWACAVRHPTDV